MKKTTMMTTMMPTMTKKTMKIQRFVRGVLGVTPLSPEAHAQANRIGWRLFESEADDNGNSAIKTRPVCCSVCKKNVDETGLCRGEVDEEKERSANGQGGVSKAMAGRLRGRFVGGLVRDLLESAL